jgi:LysM repeat protein
MRPLITVTAVVLLHLCVIAVLVGVNGCRSTSGFEQPGDNAAFSGGARPVGAAATGPAAPLPVAERIPTPVPAKLTPVGPVGNGGKRIVVKGETLMSIAASEKVTRADLAKANGLSLNADLKAGQVLTIPAAPAKAPTKAPTKAAPTKAAATKAAPAAPTPAFTPFKLLSVGKAAEAAPAPAEKK